MYGTTKPLNSWNPVWANFEHFQTIGQQLKEADGFWNKMKVLFKKPGWSAKAQAYLPFPEVERGVSAKFDTVTPPSVNYYVLLHYLINTVLTVYFLFNQQNISWMDTFSLAAILILNFAFTGGLLEGKRPYYFLEYGRIILSTIIAIEYLNRHGFATGLSIGIIVLALMSVVWMIFMKKYYLESKIVTTSIT